MLTRLKITEVSAVDRGAGENCRIVLSKRDDGAFDRSPLTLEERAKAKSIGRTALRHQEEMEARAKRDRDDETFQRYYDLFTGRTTVEEIYGVGKSYAATARGDEADMQDEKTSADELVSDDDNDDDVEKEHHASKVADLLVESGKHPDRQSALDHLLHTAHGAAMLRRLAKSHTEDTSTMTTTPEEKLSDLVKRVGITAVAAEIIKSDSAYSITEHELTDLVTEQAKRDYPTLSPAQAFTKLFTEQSDAGTVLRKAFAVVKAAGAAPYFDLRPQFVGGEDARDVDDPAKAVAQLQELGRQKWPSASEAEQFARAFDDPANAKLAAKAHRRPTPTTLYPFPK